MTIGSGQRDLILVLGGTGKTGQRVAQRLWDGGYPIRIGSRRGDPAFDWNNHSTWGAAVDGVKAVYIAYQPDLAAKGALETVDAFIECARERGAEKLVLLSGRGEEEAQRCEDALMAAGGDWTILRASWFAQNFSESFLLDAILAGHVALPAGDIPEPFVDVDDIADIAFAALTTNEHSGKLYEITGPRALTFRQAIAEISAAAGREIGFSRVTAEDYAAELARHEVPADLAELILYLFTTVLDGRNAETANGVREALGRPARDFSDYVRRTAATGIWRA